MMMESVITLHPDGFCPPQATVSLAETNYVAPDTPESLCSVKEEGEGEEEEEEEEKKPTKKRKSWGQELPTPKTNLPPRSAYIRLCPEES